MTIVSAMQLDRPGEPLRWVSRELGKPTGFELMIEVLACGVCRTDLHIVDGEIHGSLPVVPGHEIVGRIVALGEEAQAFSLGERVGVPWLGGTDTSCDYCLRGQENLCDRPIFTGFTRDGGYASLALADSRYCLKIPDRFGHAEAAPLLCAGLIGYRSLKLAGNGERLGLYGFGAAAHIVAQLAKWQGRRIFAFTRDEDTAGQEFARSLGCTWAGGSSERPPQELDTAIIFAPVGELVPQALGQVRKGGRVICAGIHMSDIPSFPYDILWGERSVQSVANLTRADGREFMAVAAEAGIHTHTQLFPLSEANQALQRLRQGEVEGAAVLIP
ncbi:MAG TPA: zinc-dependent alcohol dehydrogenase family protein [Sphingomicrobium sp.]|nr:zinc-dependent alcohol dehydrogenase family protein [Sphingomicrobium sp.]